MNKLLQSALTLFKTCIAAAALILCATWVQATDYIVIRGPTTIQSGEHVRYYSYYRDGTTGSEKYVNVNWYVYKNGSPFKDYGKGYYIGFTMDCTEDVNLTIIGVYGSTVVRLPVLLKALAIDHSIIEGSPTIAPGATEAYRFYYVYSNGQKVAKNAEWWVSAEDGTEYVGEASYVTIPGLLYNLRDITIALNAIGGDNESEQASKYVTFKAWSPTELTVSGPCSVHSNGEADYVATAVLKDANGNVVATAPVDATWSILEGAAYGSIDASGHFKAESTREERRIIIQASVGNVKSEPFPITVTPKRIVELAIDTHGKYVFEAGETAHFTAKATFDDGTEGAVEGTWTVSSPTSTGPNVGPCKAISMPVPSVKKDTRYTVRVWCVDVDTCPFAETTVTVKGKKPVKARIEGSSSVKSKAQGIQYRFIVEFSDGTMEAVEASWSISRGSNYVTGMATDASGPAVRLDFASTLSQLDNAVSLRGSYTQNGVTVYATIDITINHKTEERLEIKGPTKVTAGDSAGYTATVFYDDGTSASVSPQYWSVDSTIDTISGGTLHTKRTDDGRIDTITAVYQGNWAVVEGSKNVRVVGRGIQDPIVEGLKIISLRVEHDNRKIPTPGSEEFRAIGTFSDGKGNLFTRDVTGFCKWDIPLKNDRKVAFLAGNILFAANYGSYSELVRVQATWPSDENKLSANGYIRIEPAQEPIHGPYNNPSTIPKTVVQPGVTLNRLEIVGPDSVASRKTATYVCRAIYSDGTVVLATPEWLVAFGAGDTINAAGVLSTASAISTRTIQIQASFGGKTQTKIVTVQGRRLSSISISGPASVRSGGTAFYSCIAHYDDGTTESVWPSWSVASGVQYGSINASGTFTAVETEYGGSVEIKAFFESKVALKTVSIEPAAGKPALVSVPIYRFYSKNYKGHFFTMDEEEKNGLINSNPNWHYEGIAYYAFGQRGEGMVTLYRFYSKGYRGHFFTIDEAEKNSIIKSNPNWKYEGEAYYVYPVATEGTVPVFRFWSKGYRHHFYTTDEAEKDNLIATNPNWKYEGIAFWALEGEIVAPAASVVESLSITGPSSVESGGTAVFSCSAIHVDGSAEEVEPAWSISAGGRYATIDASGVLSASETAENRQITVRASWSGVVAEIGVTVEASVPQLLEIAIDGESNIASGTSTTLSCTAYYDDGTSVAVSPEWRIVSGGDLGTLSASGLFTAKKSASDGPVEIEASWGGMTAGWTIWVEAGNTESIAISGPDSVIAGDSATFVCTATWGDGSSENVVPAWWIVSGSEYGSISAGGVFTAQGATIQRTVSIKAAYGGKTATKAVTIIGGNWYVDAAKGKDSNNGKSCATAKRTIQSAIDASVGGDVIIVNDGVYEPISSSDKNIEIRSANGAGKTIIDASIMWEQGITNRCATFGETSTSTNTLLVGFSLKNGIASQGGGSFAGTLSNCVLVGNEATTGGGSFYSILNRCVLLGNMASTIGGGACQCLLNNCILRTNMVYGIGISSGHSWQMKFKNYGGGTYDCILNNCLLDGNTATCIAGKSYGGGSYASALNNCTLSNNKASYGKDVASGTLNNCIVWGNTSASNAVYNSTCRYSCLRIDADGEGNIVADPLFVDAANGNFRLQDGSPCKNAGSNAYAVGDKDLAGNSRIIGGTVDMGAYEIVVTLSVSPFDIKVVMDGVAAGVAAGAGMEGEINTTGGTGVTGGTGETREAGLSASPALSGDSDGNACEIAAPWTLMLRRPCPGHILAVPDVADLGDIIVEAGDESTACLAILATGANADVFDAEDAELRLTLPDGVFTAQLLNGAGTLLEESEAEGAFDFALAATGVWHCLRVLDEDGEEVFSVWLKAKER